MKLFYLICILILIGGLSFAEGRLLRGRVTDAESGHGLVSAFIALEKNATTSDSLGFFTLELSTQARLLNVSLVGYEPAVVAVGSMPIDGLIDIRLQRRIMVVSDAVLISAKRNYSDSQFSAYSETVPTALRTVKGLAMVRRGSFAEDPSLRGVDGSKLGVTIDGMKIFGACTDRMDPVNSYVERENLARLEVSKGAFDLNRGQAIGGTINLVTDRPSFARRISGYSEVGYESVADYRYGRSVLNIARDDLALRGSFSFRQADDFRPGRRAPIENSAYAKYNFKVDVSKKYVGHQLDVGVLSDRAWDIGYPALLMDTSKARSHLYHVGHVWKRPQSALHMLRTKLYFSRVDHWMDDMERDVGQREVMPDMHMPMYGQTHTGGLIANALFLGADSTLELVVDWYHLRSFADMEMTSKLPEVPDMYLLNLGDVRRDHFAGAVNYNRAVFSTVEWRLNMRFDLARHDIHDPLGRNQLAATWGYGELAQRYATLSASTAVAYMLNNAAEIRLSVANSARLPTQIESYGFYLYNPTDGYFYMGNPTLRPERSRQVELAIRYGKERRRLSVSCYYNQLGNYIVGVGSGSVFKHYDHSDRAVIYGFELEGEWPVTEHVMLHLQTSYTHGHSADFAEPLPAIAPLDSRIGLRYERSQYGAALGMRRVGEQTRIASQTTLEDSTPAFATYDIYAHWRFIEKTNLTIAVENVADRFYHEHLSIANLPSPGRNVRMALHREF